MNVFSLLALRMNHVKFLARIHGFTANHLSPLPYETTPKNLQLETWRMDVCTSGKALTDAVYLHFVLLGSVVKLTLSTPVFDSGTWCKFPWSEIFISCDSSVANFLIISASHMNSPCSCAFLLLRRSRSSSPLLKANPAPPRSTSLETHPVSYTNSDLELEPSWFSPEAISLAFPAATHFSAAPDNYSL